VNAPVFMYPASLNSNMMDQVQCHTAASLPSSLDAGSKQQKEKDMKDKEAIIEEVIAICKSNKKNMYCDKYQLIDMIREVLKLYEN
jgi:hypothetical protein